MAYVAPEFVGLARAFRSRIGAGDDAVGRIINSIAAPLVAMRRRRPTFRPETLIDAARRFQFEVPTGARLALSIVRDRHALRIEELRCAAGRFRFCSWNDPAASDADLAVVKVVLEATPFGAVGATSNILVSVSLHALSRRYQRGFDNTDETILSEFRQLALRYETIVDAMGDFALATDGGAWVGEIARTEVAGISMRMMAVRSFTPTGSPTRGTAFAAVAHA